MVDKSLGSRLFTLINASVLIVIALVTVLPFLFLIMGSFTSTAEALRKDIIIIPETFSLDAYQYIFSTKVVTRSLLVTIGVTLAGTFINLLFTSLMAYPLARRDFIFRSYFSMMVVFTMLFSGGMIPTYLVVKQLGMLNSYWSLLIPGAISAFNLIVLRNFFQAIPEGLEESARIDGCNDLHILFRIVLPLSLPALATFGLFYAVGHWNSYFTAMLYINNANMWPIQVWLRQIVIQSMGGIGDSASLEQVVPPPAQTVKMAVIVVTSLPIMAVYPFLQKHFAKGALVGSVKG